MEKLMKIILTNEVIQIMKSHGYAYKKGQWIDVNIKGGSQSYTKHFVECPFLLVEDAGYDFYNIIQPDYLNLYSVCKNHTEPYNSIKIDDKIFEW